MSKHVEKRGFLEGRTKQGLECKAVKKMVTKVYEGSSRRRSKRAPLAGTSQSRKKPSGGVLRRREGVTWGSRDAETRFSIREEGQESIL